ncbi:MAG TPA: 3'-5' exonuclease [Campylobacterales bacterium]|nr:3'-5' exonuclease [Campylobacterales bacterium]
MNSVRELESFFEKFPIEHNEIINFSKKLGFGELSPDTLIEALRACGMPIKEDSGSFILSTSHTPLKDAVFCFVDIETNGSNPRNSQVIEIGAVKYKNGEIVGSFDELIYAERLPQNIADITELTLELLKTGKIEKVVLKSFKEFLGDSVFCAHSADFDFSFLSRSFQKYNLGPILNRKICTLDFAKKTLKASKYGLKALREELGLGDPIHHRALPDAKSSAFVFEAGLKNLEEYPNSVDELIKFINAKEPKKKEPEIENE